MTAKYQVIEMDPYGEELATLSTKARYCVVLGSEGQGCQSEKLKSLLSTALKYRIPLQHQVDSLNVAVSSGLIFEKIRRF